MAFYIFPPKGNLSLAKLELHTRKRLNFLMKLADCNGNAIRMQDLLLSAATVESSDCLIEGSPKDRVSHFTLRLACAANPEMTSFFLQAESTLFLCRLSCMNKEELKAAVKPLRRYHNILSETEPSHMSEFHKDMTTFLDHVTELMDWETLIECYYHNTGHSIMLPWYFVPKLVAQRVVVLHKGYAIVDCGKLPDILRAIFDKMLSNDMTLARRRITEATQSDDRMKNLSKTFKDIYFSKFQGTLATSECVRHEHVDELVQYFPPCMKNLHKQLRERHRLGHQNRITYTLFLKEIGLPINEALQFWRQEYSQTANSESPCKHSWDKDAKRYTYNIRHLYGLEGNRINYKSYRCQKIQNSDPSPLETGGCPFKHFDRQNLTKLLKEEEVLSAGAIKTILTLVEEKDWSFACSKVYEEKKNKVLHQADRVAVSQSKKSKSGPKCDNKDVESETLCDNGSKRLEGVFEESDSVQNNRSIEEASWDSGICTLRDTRPEVRIESRDTGPEVRVESRDTRPEVRIESRDTGSEVRIESRDTRPEMRIESHVKRRRLDRTRYVGNDCCCNGGSTSAVASELGDVKYHKSLPKYSSESITCHKRVEPKGLEFTDTKLEVDGDRKMEQVAQSCCDNTDNRNTNGSQLKNSDVGSENAGSLQTDSLFWTTAVKEPGIKSDSKKALNEQSQLFYKPLDFYSSYKALVAGLRN